MARYRALRPLTYRTDPDAIRAVGRGENPPFNQSALVECEAGAIVDNLPTRSIPVLIRKGWIEPVATVAAEEGGTVGEEKSD